MSQKTIADKPRRQINAPFRAKSAGVSLVAILVIGLYYFANVGDLLQSDEAVPEGALGLALTAVVLIIVVEMALHIVLFIGAGKIEDRTERDRQIDMQASRNAYIVLSFGVIVAFGSLFTGVTTFAMGTFLLLAFFLAEIVRFGSQLMYYRRAA